MRSSGREEIGVLVSEEDGEVVQAEVVGEGLARLLDIPVHHAVNLYDVVGYAPPVLASEGGRDVYRMTEVIEPSGYRAYLAWAVHHKAQQYPDWQAQVSGRGVVVQVGAWVNSRVRHLQVALPPELGALEALSLFNRNATIVEVVCPLLAAHADDLERAKSDLERAVAWGAPDARLTFAVAEAFEAQNRWDEAVGFWERLASILPTYAPAHERLALSYAHLGVFSLAAPAFDRAAHLTEDTEHSRRLEAARDLMWERSKM